MSAEMPAIGLATLQGILFTDSWYWNLNDETRAFADRFFAVRKAMPTSYQAGVYSSVTHYLQAVQAAGTTEPKAVMAKMRALSIMPVSPVLSVMIANLIVEDGETNWFEGLQLFAAYVIIAVAFYFHP